MNKKTTRKEFLKFAKYDNRLLQLEERIKDYLNMRYRKKSYCADAVWYKTFGDELTNLVGWNADDIRLQSLEAYNMLHSYLCNLLPEYNYDSLICDF